MVDPFMGDRLILFARDDPLIVFRRYDPLNVFSRGDPFMLRSFVWTRIKHCQVLLNKFKDHYINKLNILSFVLFIPVIICITAN